MMPVCKQHTISFSLFFLLKQYYFDLKEVFGFLKGPTSLSPFLVQSLDFYFFLFSWPIASFL